MIVMGSWCGRVQVKMELPPALYVNISFSLAHMRHYATQSQMESTIHKNTSHAQCNAEHRDGSTTAGCADVQKSLWRFILRCPEWNLQS